MAHRPPKRGTSKAAAEERKARFVEAYITLGENATRAYLEVYGDGKSYGASAVSAHQLLKDPKVHQMIEALRAELRAKFSLTTDRVMHELARVSYFTPKRLVDAAGRAIPLHKLDDDTAAALAAVEITETKMTQHGAKRVTVTKKTKGRPYNKVSALEKSIKILRLYDKPPPPPPDETGRPQTDPREVARRMIFLLAQGAAENEKAEQPVPNPKRKKIKIPS